MAQRINALPAPLATAFYFIVSLFPLVLAHELGHFVVAKLCRVGVDEFGFGFPPRLLRMTKIGETEYTLNALPLGGFVKLSGEDDPAVPGAFAARGKRVRTAVLLAGPIANFALAAFIFAAMAWSGLIPEAVYGVDGARVAQVAPDSPAQAAGLLPNDVVLAVDGQPLAGSAAPAAGPDRAEQTVSALVTRTDASGGQPMRLTVLRGDLQPLPSGTDLSGVQLGVSRIQGVNGRQVLSAPAGTGLAAGDVVLDVASADGGTAGSLAVLHQPKVVEVVVVPHSAGAGQPARMGVQISTPSVPLRYGLVAGTVHGIRFTGTILHAMLTALARMVTGRASVQLAGPVGISIMSRQMGEQGLVPLLEFMALLSLNLGLINLLPIPALDGGRLIFILAEAVRGKRVEPAREAVVHLIGFVAVIALMGVLTLVEVARLTGITKP